MKSPSHVDFIKHTRLICIIAFTLFFVSTASGQIYDGFSDDDEDQSLKFARFGSITGATGKQGESLGLKFSGGILTRNELALGLGIGYDKYDDDTLVPLFLDLRLFPSLYGKSCPYYFLNIGYSLDSRHGFGDFDNEGLYFNGGGGMVILRNSRGGMTLDFGYRIQRIEGGGGGEKQGFLSIGIGLMRY